MRFLEVNTVFPTGLIVWFDDRRSIPAKTEPDHWYDLHVNNAESMMRLIGFGYVGYISFDNDLGTALEGQHVSRYIKELAEAQKIPPIRAKVHSLNSSAAKCIVQDMKRSNEYWGVDWNCPYIPDFR